MAGNGAAGRGGSHGLLFARTKFRPPALPATLLTRSGLHGRLAAGASRRLTVIVGSAGAGKSVLLSSWAAARPPGMTSWVSCDEADANPVRFWTGFIEAAQSAEPGFGVEAADLLAMDGTVSPDVTASIANDAAKLPAGSAVVVDDFHYAAPTVSVSMTDLVERWPAQAAQLVLASRSDPPLRLHRLRLSGELCELRDSDLYFSTAECRALLANFGVEIGDADLATLHRRSEGWAAALQMAALSLHGADPERASRALDIRSHAIAEYFAAEVLDHQPPEVARFMLDTSVLTELTAEACSAVTGSQDAASLLRGIDAANLFLVPQDEERTSFRYHHLVHQLLRAELRVRDPAREQALQLRAGEWFEATGDSRRAARHFLAAKQVDRALTLLQDRVVADYLQDPALPSPPDLSMVDPSLLADVPGRLLGVAAELLLSGEVARGGSYLELLERAQPPIPPDSPLAARLATVQSTYYGLIGKLDEAVDAALTARSIAERAPDSDNWTDATATIMLRAYTVLEDYEAVEREAAALIAMPGLAEPVKLVMVPGSQALAHFEAGRLAEAAEAAGIAEEQARRLGFDRHFFTWDYLRAQAGLALEYRDLDTAEQLAERALSLSERVRPPFEFLALLDRATIWAARSQPREALITIDAARSVLPEAGPVLLQRADELEALIRLALGDLQSPADLTKELPAVRRDLVLARIALTAGDHKTAHEHLQRLPPSDLTPRRAVVRQILMAATAIERGDPTTAGNVAGLLQAARRGRFLGTVVTTAPQVTSYLVEHATELRLDPFTEQLIGAALQVRAAQPDGSSSGRAPASALTTAELRVLKLLPTSTYLQMAATLYVSRSTVKTHLRSIYQKLGVTSRSAAIERAVDLRLL